MAHRFPQIPLKDMDGAMLVLELQRNLSTMLSDAGAERVFSAAQVATHLHRNQSRSVRKNLPQVPYIEHPVRNTLRLMRWGVTDPDVLVASLLHDVPEDCAKEVVQMFMRRDNAALSAPTPQHAVLWIGEAYGSTSGDLVGRMTNPEQPPGLSKIEKDLFYADHVRRDILPDPKAVLLKATDIFDNAGSLIHQFDQEPRKGFVSSKLTKYEPVVDMLVDRLKELAADTTNYGEEYVNAAAAMGTLQRNLGVLRKKVEAQQNVTPRQAAGEAVITPDAAGPQLSY